ncbi:MAG: ATPase with chaperone activity, partial [Planctomycetota bacterium]
MSTPADSQRSKEEAESQLDALISRIQSLTGTEGTGAPPQQPRPASAVTQAIPKTNAPRPAAGQPTAQSNQAMPQPPVRQPPTQQPTPQGKLPPHPGSVGAMPAGPPKLSQPGRPATPQVPQAPTQGAIPKRSLQAQPGTATAGKPAEASQEPIPTPKPAHGPTIKIPDGPIGFKSSRDEPWRPVEPETLEASGINESVLEAIIYRFLLTAGEASGRRISDQVKLPFRLIEPILARLKMEQNIAYRDATATNDYIYILTESGRQIARNHNSDCTYFGSCPVRLPDYIQSVKYQTIEGQYPKKADLVRAFSDLLINPKMLNRLGPAIASGRGMFLFGFPGNGKTSIAERVTGAFGKYIWVPRSVDIDGDVLRIYDPMNHELEMPDESSGLLDVGGFDKRWVRIRRPTIVAGGELTMEMLEVLCNSDSNISESPLQLKSNCGTLVIDDFGRQKMRVDELLNRWIVPLEKRYDFLNMASGKKIQVPFDQLVIFSTNLEPKDLVDDAFLRRIPYKIEVENPPE